MEIEIKRTVIDKNDLKMILEVTEKLSEIDKSVHGDPGSMEQRFNESILRLVQQRVTNKMTDVIYDKYKQEIIDGIDLSEIIKDIHFDAAMRAIKRD